MITRMNGLFVSFPREGLKIVEFLKLAILILQKVSGW
jgi:hypothetical protein